MDNLEFCNLLKEAKRLSGKSNVDIIVALRKSQGTLSDMLNGRSDYTLSKYLPYIQAVGFCLTINSDGENVKIKDNSDATCWIQKMLKEHSYSSYELGKELGVSHQTALRIANGGALRLSVFLKFVELFQSSITLDAN